MNDGLFADRLFNALDRQPPAAGMLLVAAPGMLAPEFARSVVFIIEHGADGTLGVDLTARSETPLHNVLPEWESLASAPKVLYVGGPVQRTLPLCLGVSKIGADAEANDWLEPLVNRFVMVNLNGTAEEVTEDLDGARVFAGYSGWDPGQLHDEIERGDWYVTPALPSDLLAPGRVDLWGAVMRRQEMPLPLYASFPVSVRSN